MERKEYLELCQRCAVLQDGLMGTKVNISDELKVVYNGIQYRPKAYLLTFTKEGKSNHTAILQEIKSPSEMYCDLERVNRYESGNNN